MRKAVGVDVSLLVLSIALVFEPALNAQQSAPPDAPSPAQSSSQVNTSPPMLPNTPLADISVPVPVQIRAAKTVFIANAGDKTNLFPDVYSGGPDRPYVQFYSDMQNWGHYTLVSSPDKADLVFQIGLVNPIASELLGGENAGYWNGAEWHDPQLRLSILDAKTRISLWQLTSHIQSTAGLKASRDKQFELAMSKLVAEVEQLSTQTMTTENSSLLRQKGHARRIKIMAIVSIAVAAAGISAVAIMASHRPSFPNLPPPAYPTLPSVP